MSAGEVQRDDEARRVELTFCTLSASTCVVRKRQVQRGGQKALGRLNLIRPTRETPVPSCEILPTCRPQVLSSGAQLFGGVDVKVCELRRTLALG